MVLPDFIFFAFIRFYNTSVERNEFDKLYLLTSRQIHFMGFAMKQRRAGIFVFKAFCLKKNIRIRNLGKKTARAIEDLEKQRYTGFTVSIEKNVIARHIYRNPAFSEEGGKSLKIKENQSI